MAKVTLMDGIQSISGKLGDVCYRTHKNGTVSVAMLPRKRRTPVSEKEKQHRQWFKNLLYQITEVDNSFRLRWGLYLTIINHTRTNNSFLQNLLKMGNATHKVLGIGLSRFDFHNIQTFCL